MPPKPISTNADHFAFESNSGDRLDLYGALLSWTGSTRTGVVEKQVVQRAGAIFQRVGAPPRRWEFRCRFVGPTCRADFQRVQDVALYDPEGQLTHPRHGQLPAVIEEVTDSESPGDDKDTIDFTLRIAESGLRTAPKPSPAALGHASTAAGAAVAAESSSGTPGVAAAGALVSTRSSSLLVALQAAETGLGSLLDVDATLEALSNGVLALDDHADMPPLARRAAYGCLSLALQARNSFLAGRPPLVWYRVERAQSLSNLMQYLFGGRGRAERDLCERLNRITSARLLPAGTRLLLTDPTAKPVAS